jgi:hypothetical protein
MKSSAGQTSRAILRHMMSEERLGYFQVRMYHFLLCCLISHGNRPSSCARILLAALGLGTRDSESPAPGPGAGAHLRIVRVDD